MSRRAKADLALVLITLFWGATFTVVKGALDHASVFAFMVARFALAALLMAVIYRKALRQLSRAEILAGAQIGFLMFAGYALQTFGLVQTTPSKAAFITGSSVVMVPVLLALFWKRRIGIGVWAGALAALAGLYYLSVPREGFSRLNPGDPLVLVCALMFALHIILVGRYSGEHSVGGLSFLQVATTAILAIVALPVAGAAKLESLRFDASSELVTAVLITAVLATAVLAIVALPVAGAAKLESLRFDGSSELITAVLITAVLATAVAFSVQVWRSSTPRRRTPRSSSASSRCSPR